MRADLLICGRWKRNNDKSQSASKNFMDQPKKEKPNTHISNGLFLFCVKPFKQTNIWNPSFWKNRRTCSKTMHRSENERQWEVVAVESVFFFFLLFCSFEFKTVCFNCGNDAERCADANKTRAQIVCNLQILFIKFNNAMNWDLFAPKLHPSDYNFTLVLLFIYIPFM